jgi:hypothetical protein
MRVIECNRCSETLTAANDSELARVVRRHFSAEHGEELDDDALQDLCREAYSASDS